MKLKGESLGPRVPGPAGPGLTNLNDGGADPARVRQHEREEQVGVDLVPEAAHLPENNNGQVLKPGTFGFVVCAQPPEPHL